jgi:hypothetical protein
MRAAIDRIEDGGVVVLVPAPGRPWPCDPTEWPSGAEIPLCPVPGAREADPVALFMLPSAP